MAGPRVVMYGVGSMGSIIARMLQDKGAVLVGGVCRSEEKEGKDLGELVGIGAIGARVTRDAESLLDTTNPDVVVMTIASYMTDVKEPILRCLRRGINVISLSEELAYSWHTSPVDTAEIDECAKANGVSFLSSGHQDGYWISLVSTLLGTVHRAERVEGKATWNVDDFGPELARDQQVGKTVEEFDTWIRTADRPPSFGRNSLHALAACLGLVVATSRTETAPEVAQADIHCAALDTDVLAGRVIGFTDTDIVETTNGIGLTLKMAGKVYGPDESDSNEWTVVGEPSLNLVNTELPTHLTTCATLVNRLPDAIAAHPGYLTIDMLPRLTYRSQPLSAYLPE